MFEHVERPKLLQWV